VLSVICDELLGEGLAGEGAACSWLQSERHFWLR
jgi:hypothetical protein